MTEFTDGSLVVKLNGKQYTPPIKYGSLVGTFRKELLNRKKHGEITIKVELKDAEDIWFIKSVRKWLKVSYLNRF